MIITIDGPAGAGKSAVAQRLAQSLGFKHLDTGAMYRAVALAALEEGLDGDPDGLARRVGQIQVSFDWSSEPPRVRLDGRDVTDAIRTPRVTQATHLAASNPQVRAVLVEQQRRIAAAAGSLVTEGRDQGTVVFPTAEYKFYLDASLQERARRRAVQWRDQGRAVTLDSLATQLQQRDDRDRNRGVGSLTIPPGAIVIDTTPLTLQEVVELMRRTVQGQPRVSYTYRGEGTGWFQTLLWTVGRFLLQTIAILFFRVRITGRENIPRRGAALLATNHQSLLDPWLIGIALERQIHYLARESLFRGGFVQYVFERTNAFPIRRGRADTTAIREAIARLQRGYLVNIFPEATRTIDGTIGPIAAGLAVIIHRARVPLIPVVIEGAFEAWPRGKAWPRLRSIRLHYGRPLSYAELVQLSPDALAVRLRSEMIRLQRQLGSPHAAASQQRFAADWQQGRRRAVAREITA